MKRGVGRVGVFLAASIVVLAASTAPATAAPARSQGVAAGHQVAEAGVTTSATDGLSIGTGLASAQRHARSTRPLAKPAMSHIAVPAAISSAGSLLANFNGVSSLDSGITNFGAEFEPPDQGLCAGNGFVVEMVNSAYRVYDTKGTSLAGPFNINRVFHEGFKQFTSDPRCHFDPATNTWFAVILFLNSTSTGSRIDIAVKNGDPRGDWTEVRINTTHAGGPGCPCFGDQPTLGIDASNLYVTTNEFSITGPAFNGAQIYAVSKSDLIANPTKVHFVHYGNLFIGGAQAASVQPALTFGPAGAEYFLSSLDPNGTGDNRVGVWALTDVDAVGSGGMPVLSSKVIASQPYAIPPAAKQKGLNSSTLDSGDDRMQQVQFIGGDIWGALDTTVWPSGDNAPRAGAAWFRVKPQLSGSKLGGASLVAGGYVASVSEYVMYPAIQADGNGHAAMVFTLTGAHRFASAAYAVMSGSNFGSPKVAASGTGPYDPAATRWGDYSWAVLDPSGTSVWFATEYMPPVSSQTKDGLRNWGTRVLQVPLA